jgi:hypothetical protein
MMFLLSEGTLFLDLSNFRLDGFIRRCQRLGIPMDVGEDGRGLMKSLAGITDSDIRTVYSFSIVLIKGS